MWLADRNRAVGSVLTEGRKEQFLPMDPLGYLGMTSAASMPASLVCIKIRAKWNAFNFLLAGSMEEWRE